MTDQPELFSDESFIEVPDAGEGVEDLTPLNQDSISQAVVSATDWTTETIINQINKGNIQLNPRFQRRDAWENKRKSRFIESLILGLPIPQLVLAESKESRGSYIVIDGKQRLLSIRQFAAEPNDSVYQQLKLSGLSIRRDLQRRSLSDLHNDPSYFADLSAFENQPIRTVVIKNWGNEDFLYQVFLRLNTGSVPLSPQELRQALHPGPFVEFADLRSGESPALREILKLTKPDFRMRDAELLIRYFAFRYYIHEYSGNLKNFLDVTCERLNQTWSEEEGRITSQVEQFEEAYRTTKIIFKKDFAFRKWTPKGYEKPFNRAIFDIMMYFFTEREVRKLAGENAQSVESAFKALCIEDSEFLASIERTTKSIGATGKRLSIWAHTLNAVLGTSLSPPLS